MASIEPISAVFAFLIMKEQFYAIDFIGYGYDFTSRDHYFIERFTVKVRIKKIHSIEWIFFVYR